MNLHIDYPFTFSFLNTTLHLREKPSSKVAQALKKLIKHRHEKKQTRASAPLSTTDTSLFAKVQPLDSFKAKVRVTLGKPQRNGRFDWPLEELINTQEAQSRGVNMPPLQGYGYTKGRLGLTHEYFIITHLLEDHINGVEWLQKHPERVEQFVRDAFALLGSLTQKEIIHMDFWAGNIMLPPTVDAELKVIDFENYFARPAQHHSETLGFQLGFFYRREIYKLITEADYDRLVDEYVGQQQNVSSEKFHAFYQPSKHEHVGRKQRRDVYLSGQLVVG